MCPSFEPVNHVWPSFLKLVFTVRMIFSLAVDKRLTYNDDFPLVAFFFVIYNLFV